MTKVLLGFFMLFSCSAISGSFESIVNLKNTKEVAKLEQSMEAQGMSLLSIKDVYLDTGLRPKCPCELYEVVYKADSGETKTFAIDYEFLPGIAKIREVK